jgi:hypothetical protein
MRSLLAIGLILLLSACSGGYYKISPKEYQQQVKTLGVLPLLLDDQSTILHPEREQVLEALARHNAGKADWLIETLRNEKSYFDVRAVPGEPRAFFRQLVSASGIHGEGAGRFRRYAFNGDAVAEECRKSGVDALLVVILNGLDRSEKHWDRDRTNLSFLQTDYNVVIASAAVVMATGEVVWEYPGEPGAAFLNLQYPDFDEAFFNGTDQVRLHFVTLEGLDRTLSRRDSGILFKTSLAQRYKELFASLVMALEPGLLTQLGSGGDPKPPASR